MKTFYFIIIFLVCNCVTVIAQLACFSGIQVSIAEDGTAILTPSTILSSPMNPSRRYELSHTNFNCADVNNTYPITVYEYESGVLINSCFSLITIVNKFDTPLPCGPVRAWCSEGAFPLNSDGELTVTPAMMAGGDVSPAFNYTVEPSHFDCSDIGVQTVTVTVTSTDNVSVSCSSEITITNPSVLISPCFRLNINIFRTFPTDIFINPLLRGTSIPFELIISKSQEIKKQVAGKLVMVLSKDQEISKDDKILYSNNFKLKNKDQKIAFNNKFMIPSEMDLGDYYFILDVVSEDAKEMIGFEKYIKHVTINNKLNPTENRKKLEKVILDDSYIFPNPTSEILTIHTENSNQPKYFEIFDLYGKRLNQGMLAESVTEVKVDALADGMYLINIIEDNKNIKSIKFIKSN
jgi:hypothetical protein